MSLLAKYLSTDMTIEERASYDACGNTAYSAPVDVRGTYYPTEELLKVFPGEECMINATIRVLPSVSIPKGSRVTIQGEVFECVRTTPIRDICGKTTWQESALRRMA